MTNALQRAADLCGGASVLAGLLGVSVQVVSNWRGRGVPASRCPMIERATLGQVKCEELRPDIEWAVLRGKRGIRKSHSEPKPNACGERRKSERRKSPVLVEPDKRRRHRREGN